MKPPRTLGESGKEARMKALLENVLQTFRSGGIQQDDSLLSPLSFDSYDEQKDEITLVAPSAFYREQFYKRYAERVRQALTLHGMGSPAIACHILPRSSLEQLPLPSLEPTAQDSRAARPARPHHRNNRRLIENLSFHHFITGPSNQFAYTYSKSVAENPGRNFNPLFIYGGSGLGKTHLLNAIALELRSRFPSIRITYQTAEDFTNQMISHIQRKKDAGFREAYRRRCDALLIDDIQFISGKERTTEEFFHIFNALYEAEKQIVLTSDLYPKEISGLPERLRSRFAMGLIADIQPPELETRIAILKEKAGADGFRLSEEVAYYIADVCSDHVRQLESALLQLRAYSSLAGEEVSVDMAREVLHNTRSREVKPITVDGILKAVAGYYALKVTDIRGSRKHKAVAYPRQQAMYLTRKLTGLSYPDIGRRFGGKDHSTVIHAEKKITRKLEEDPELGRVLSALEEIARQKS